MNAAHPSYLLFVGVGVIIALAFPVARHIQDPRLRRQYYLLQGITLVGAVIGAKLSVLFGDYHWPWAPVSDLPGVLWSGRSITGALILGFLCAEAAKPLVGYTMPPNDRFAALLPFTVAVGRFGCLTAGCCRGLPYDGWCALRGVDGVTRYPAQLWEIIFQITVGGIFILLVRRRALFGGLFSLYLVLYGVFRFVTEFFRETPKFYGGFSGYQILSLVMIALGAAFFLKRTIAPPAVWARFKTKTEDLLTPALPSSRGGKGEDGASDKQLMRVPRVEGDSSCKRSHAFERSAPVSGAATSEVHPHTRLPMCSGIDSLLRPRTGALPGAADGKHH